MATQTAQPQNQSLTLLQSLQLNVTDLPETLQTQISNYNQLAADYASDVVTAEENPTDQEIQTALADDLEFLNDIDQTLYDNITSWANKRKTQKNEPTTTPPATPPAKTESTPQQVTEGKEEEGTGTVLAVVLTILTLGVGGYFFFRNRG
jgi:hypothetical protein